MSHDLDDADVVLTLKSHAKRQSQKLREARGRNVEVHVVRSNTLTQMENFLREAFGVRNYPENEESGMQEVEDAVLDVVESNRPVELVSAAQTHTPHATSLHRAERACVGEQRAGAYAPRRHLPAPLSGPPALPETVSPATGPRRSAPSRDDRCNSL